MGDDTKEAPLTCQTFQADTGGNIQDCGQGGGLGFMVEAASADDNLKVVYPGAFPIQARMEGRKDLTRIISGPQPVYDAPFTKLTLAGCTASAYYRVWIFRSRAQGIGPAPQANAQGEVPIFSGVLAANDISGTAVFPIFCNPAGGFIFAPAQQNFTLEPAPFDVRAFKGIRATCYLYGTTLAGEPDDLYLYVRAYPSALGCQEAPVSSKTGLTAAPALSIDPYSIRVQVHTNLPAAQNDANNQILMHPRAGSNYQGSANSFTNTSNSVPVKPSFITCYLQYPSGYAGFVNMAYRVDIAGLTD